MNLELARRTRKYLERTQASIAEEIGVDPSTVYRWELGEVEPRVGQAVAWARALGLPLVDLLGETKPEMVGTEADG